MDDVWDTVYTYPDYVASIPLKALQKNTRGKQIIKYRPFLRQKTTGYCSHSETGTSNCLIPLFRKQPCGHIEPGAFQEFRA